MLARTWQAGATFVALIGAYWLYALLVVPWIEPAARGAAGSGGTSPGQKTDAVDAQRRELALFFQPDEWEYQSPKVLENSQGKLLLRDYHQLGDGRVEIKPCTMIFLPEGKYPSDAERKRRAVVLRAPEGAVLQFDAPFDLSRGRVGRLISGRLVGKVTVRSDQHDPGPEDDLRIDARDIDLSETSITSASPLEFQLGPHHGRGVELRIDLKPRDGENEPGLNFGPFTSFQLVHDVELVLAPGADDVLPSPAVARRADGAATATPTKRPQPKPPVRIRCQGPFQFDMTSYVASFEKEVEVTRLEASKQPDRLTCDRLAVEFAHDAPPAAAKGARRQPFPKLRPAVLRAWGSPVLLNSPSSGVYSRAKRMEYKLETRSGMLRDDDDVLLRQGTNEVHGRAIDFQSVPGGWGTFVVTGAGWLHATMPGRGLPDRQSLLGAQPPREGEGHPIDARWTKQLRFRPFEQRLVLSVEGASHLEGAGLGSLDAEEFHLWLIEPPRQVQDKAAQAKSGQLLPDKMLARGIVRINSPQLVTHVDQLEMWFEYLTVPQGEMRTVGYTPSEELPQPPDATATHSLPNPAVIQPRPHTTGPVTQYGVDGDLLQVQMRVRGNQQEIAQAVVERKVHFRELSSRPGELPLDVTGDRLELVQPEPGKGTLVVTGVPAVLAARGLTLRGGAINLDQGQNVVWSEGPGRLTLQGKQAVDITWQDRMDFDGNKASFSRHVQAQMDLQLVKTALLEATLTRSVRFTGMQPADTRPELLQIFCRGGVHFEQREMAGTQVTGIQHLDLLDLTINKQTGEIAGSGPGQLTSVRMGEFDGGAMLPGAGSPKPPSQPIASGKTELTYLGVKFEGGMAGNLLRREVSFQELVRCIYAPVPTWESQLDPDRPEQLTDQGMVMTCQQLTVAETPESKPGLTFYEVSANGNAEMEGLRGAARYNAHASRMSYDQAKGQIVLDSEGRSPVDLYRQTTVGGAYSKASGRRIRYWPKSGRFLAEDAHSLDLTDLQGLK